MTNLYLRDVHVPTDVTNAAINIAKFEANHGKKDIQFLSIFSKVYVIEASNYFGRFIRVVKDFFSNEEQNVAKVLNKSIDKYQEWQGSVTQIKAQKATQKKSEEMLGKNRVTTTVAWLAGKVSKQLAKTGIGRDMGVAPQLTLIDPHSGETVTIPKDLSYLRGVISNRLELHK
jgi:hypothetical protein